MTSQRISIVGCSGSGKTTLTRRLAGLLKCPSLELDSIHHQPDWTPVDDRSFLARVDEFTSSTDSWIVDGNYRVVLPLVWSRSSHVIWLHPPRWRVMLRLLRRSGIRLALRRRLWNGNRERLVDVLSTDPSRSVLAGGWVGHAAYGAEYRKRLDAPEASHLKVHEVVDPIGCSKLIEEFGSACEVGQEVGGRHPGTLMNGEVPTDS